MGQGSNGNPRPRSELFKSGIPTFIREIISAEARAGVKDVDIAKSWGVSATAVRYAEEGRIGEHQLKGEEKELDINAEKNVELIKNDIALKTTRKLSEVIATVDPESVRSEKPIIQTAIARNLAAVIEKISPKVIGQQNNIQYNVFYPKQKSIEEFGEPIQIVEEQIKQR